MRYGLPGERWCEELLDEVIASDVPTFVGTSCWVATAGCDGNIDEEGEDRRAAVEGEQPFR